MLFKNSLILAQTDTTVGFLSKNPNLINIKKNRQGKKGLIKVVSSFKELNDEVRVPKKFRKYIRHSKQTTFIYAKHNKAIRVVLEGIHHDFLKRFKSFYSSSANISGSYFIQEVAEDLADIIFYKKDIKFQEKAPSKIYKIYLLHKQKIR